MIELAKSGMTMIVVSHEMGFARAVANDIIFMENGVIVEEGTPEAMFNYCKTPGPESFYIKLLNFTEERKSELSGISLEYFAKIVRRHGSHFRAYHYCYHYGALLGIPTALGRVYGSKLIYIFVLFCGDFPRYPLLTQLFILYFGLPSVGVMLSPFTAAVIGMGLNSAAYQAEYFRGAIQSVKEEQLIAAYSLGMKQVQAIRYVVLPQMLASGNPFLVQ